MDPENISQWKWHLDLKLERCVVRQAREKGPVCAWSLRHDRVPLAWGGITVPGAWAGSWCVWLD